MNFMQSAKTYLVSAIFRSVSRTNWKTKKQGQYIIKIRSTSCLAITIMIWNCLAVLNVKLFYHK